MNDNYLDELNEVQRKAVECIDGPVMIVAGAGSGKTRVLTYRVAHLIRKGIDPFNILSLTFTNKAAREMKERIGKIVSKGEARNLWMGTFHSVFARILRAEAERLGYPKNFTIYDTDDCKNLIKIILKEHNLDEKIYKPSLVLGRISSAKNNMMSAQAYLQNKAAIAEDNFSKKPEIGFIYNQYQKRCFKAGAMDFDDLLFNTNILLRDCEGMLEKYQQKFKYIMVDEYQDTNFSQYVIVKQLAEGHKNICVVGDDAQSIYSFRGANIQNILSFERDYPNLHVFKLEQNYRSTQNIVNAANAVIAKNLDQIQKNVWTSNDWGNKIKTIEARPPQPSLSAENVEAQKVAGSIFETKMNEQAQNSDFAILYRTNSLSRAMEEALRKKNIPYRILSGLSFYQRKAVKDLIAYFRLTLNPNDEQAFRRVINFPARQIGDTTIDKITIAARDHGISLFTVCDNIDGFSLGINSGTKQRIKDFVTMIKGFGVRVSFDTAYDLGHHIASHSGLLKELYSDKTPEGVSHYENIEELLNGLKEFSDGDEAQPIELYETDPELARIEAKHEGELFSSDQSEKEIRTLDLYMQDIALLTDADKKESAEEKDRVSLMTIHAAKGLEFPYVYVIGLEENLFPSALALNSRSELEEERRLFYVAITRAEKQCTLSWAVSRYKWGNLVFSEKSRFVDEIDEKYIELPFRIDSATLNEPTFGIKKRFPSGKQSSTPLPKQATNPPRKNLVKATTLTSGSVDNSHLKNLQEGMNVRHDRFGVGKVLRLEGNYPDTKAAIFFTDIGEKKLFLKFAKLEIIV